MTHFQIRFWFIAILVFSFWIFWDFLIELVTLFPISDYFWYPDFAIKTQGITYLGGDRLEVYTFTDFYPDDIYEREDSERYDYFIKSN